MGVQVTAQGHGIGRVLRGKKVNLGNQVGHNIERSTPLLAKEGMPARSGGWGGWGFERDPNGGRPGYSKIIVRGRSLIVQRFNHPRPSRWLEHPLLI
ncbi:hypothetical protein GCM10022407_20760 [Hymenobacter antarcticus]|uniref:Uncharacterized protein n=1 Tax=Hymenobacter antarcticus TaxID=486270 RepID=A0ABP7Q2A4_9BACT